MNRRRRLQAAYAALAVVALAFAGGSTWLLTRGSPQAATCGEQIPAGRTVEVAWRTTELFVADVLLSREPACGYDLSTRHLRASRSRADWARGHPVRPFARGYPPVSIARASRDPHARQAVYILSRREAGFVSIGADGRLEIPMMVGLSAPNTGRGAYDLALVVEDGSWRVDRVARVPIFDN